MSTPYTLTAGIALRAVSTLAWLWALVFLIGRIHAFHEAFIAESQRLEDERYLLERCQDPEFYSNIRQHTGICAEVQANARANVYLKALNAAAQGAHLCGARDCTEVARMIVARLTWQAAGVLIIVLIFFPHLVSRFAAAIGWRRHVWVERGMIVRHSRSGISRAFRGRFYGPGAAPQPSKGGDDGEWVMSAPFYPDMGDGLEEGCDGDADGLEAPVIAADVCGDLRKRHPHRGPSPLV